jgi:hypothetical protein
MNYGKLKKNCIICGERIQVYEGCKRRDSMIDHLLENHRPEMASYLNLEVEYCSLEIAEYTQPDFIRRQIKQHSRRSSKCRARTDLNMRHCSYCEKWSERLGEPVIHEDWCHQSDPIIDWAMAPASQF